MEPISLWCYEDERGRGLDLELPEQLGNRLEAGLDDRGFTLEFVGYLVDYAIHDPARVAVALPEVDEQGSPLCEELVELGGSL